MREDFMRARDYHFWHMIWENVKVTWKKIGKHDNVMKILKVKFEKFVYKLEKIKNYNTKLKCKYLS